MFSRRRIHLSFVACGVLACAWLSFAGYKARRYEARPIDSYPCKLTSEGITVAIDPLFSDELAAKVFDKKDIVSSGVMPVAIIISNKNKFPVEFNGFSIELIVKEERVQPLAPEQAVRQIFQYGRSEREVRIPSPVPFPRVEITRANYDAFDDFNYKHLGIKRVEPDSVSAGFVYIPLKKLPNLRESLWDSRIYLPDLRRADLREPMIFFEIDLKPALDSIPKK
jgi:hypothetical protein